VSVRLRGTDTISAGSSNTSFITIPGDNDTLNLGLTNGVRDRLYPNGSRMTHTDWPTLPISYYFRTGDTAQTEWHIGDSVIDKNSSTHIFSPDNIRQQHYPISHTKNMQVKIYNPDGTTINRDLINTINMHIRMEMSNM